MLRKLVLNATYYTGLQLALAPVFRGVGSILMLHHVRNVKWPDFAPNAHLTVSPEFLDQLLGELGQTHDFVDMNEMADRLSHGRTDTGRPFLAVTLDDGYIDNIDHAAPIFRKHNAPYMIYVSPNMVTGKSRVWWEDLESVISVTDGFSVEFPRGVREFDTSTTELKYAAYKECMEYLFLEVKETHQRQIVSQLCAEHGVDDLAHAKSQVANWRQLKKLKKDDPLCSLGAHSMNHYVLSKLNMQDLMQEMNESRRILSSQIDSPVEHFAYPYGYVEAAGPREFRVAEEVGFKTAVTTRHGVIYKAHSEHMTALPRVSVNGHHQSVREIKTLLSGVPTRLKNYGSQLDVA